MTKMTLLAPLVGVDGTEVVAAVRGGATYKATLDDLIPQRAHLIIRADGSWAVVDKKYRQVIKTGSTTEESLVGSIVTRTDNFILRRKDRYGRVFETIFNDGTHRSGSTADADRPLSTRAVRVWAGAPTTTGFRVACDVEGFGPGVCQLVVSSDAAMARREFIGPRTMVFETARTDLDNYRSVKLEALGLPPSAVPKTWYYRVDVDGQPGTVQQIKALPTAGDVRIVVGSCSDRRTKRNWPSMTAILARNPDLFVDLGDLSYSDIGDDDLRLQREQNSRGPRRSIPEFIALVAALGVVYQPDNHDTAKPNLYLEAYGATTYGRVVANSNQTYSETVPHYDFATDGNGPIGLAFSRDVVAARWIFLDCVTFRAAGVMLGARQTAWLQAQIAGAAAAGMNQVLIFSSENWTTEDMGWATTAPAEQVALCNFIRDTAGIPPTTVIDGDLHFCAVSDRVTTDKSSGGGLRLLRVTASGLAAPSTALALNPNVEFTWNGAASHFYPGAGNVWMEQFVELTIYAAGGWTAKIYGAPFVAGAATLLGTFNSADIP